MVGAHHQVQLHPEEQRIPRKYSIGGWGERVRASTPLGTGKSFRFGRACVRAVSVMSFREEKVRRGGCIFYLSTREIVSFISCKILSLGFLWLFPQATFPRELSKRDCQESFPRYFQERFPRDISKRDSQERFPRDIPKRDS